MTFDTFSILFCVGAGLLLGMLGLVYRVLSTGCVGISGAFMDRGDDGGPRILSSWNIGLFSAITIVALLAASRYEDSFVSLVIRHAWDYGVQRGVFG